MVCLGFEPGAAGWKAQTNPLSYGSTLMHSFWPIKYQNTSQPPASIKILYLSGCVEMLILRSDSSLLFF